MDEPKKTKDIIIGLKGIMKAKDDDAKREEIPAEQRQMYMATTNVAAVIPKNKETEELIKATFDLEPKKTINLDYLVEKGDLVRTKYGAEYLKVVLDMTKNYKDIWFSMKKDYPLSVECEDFIFVIAPRVESD